MFFSLFSDELGSPSLCSIFDSFDIVYIINSGRHTPFILITDLSDGATQDFTTSCLGKFFHEDNSNQASKGSYIVSYLGLNLIFESCLLLEAEL